MAKPKSYKKKLPKYPDGRKPPIYVTNPNDPKLKDYQNRLNLYNASEQWRLAKNLADRNRYNEYINTPDDIYRETLNTSKQLALDKEVKAKYEILDKLAKQYPDIKPELLESTISSLNPFRFDSVNKYSKDVPKKLKNIKGELQDIDTISPMYWEDPSTGIKYTNVRHKDEKYIEEPFIGYKKPTESVSYIKPDWAPWPGYGYQEMSNRKGYTTKPVEGGQELYDDKGRLLGRQTIPYKGAAPVTEILKTQYRTGGTVNHYDEGGLTDDMNLDNPFKRLFKRRAPKLTPDEQYQQAISRAKNSLDNWHNYSNQAIPDNLREEYHKAVENYNNYRAEKQRKADIDLGNIKQNKAKIEEGNKNFSNVNVKAHGGYMHNNMAGKLNKRKGLPSRFPMYEGGGISAGASSAMGSTGSGFDYTSLIGPTLSLLGSLNQPQGSPDYGTSAGVQKRKKSQASSDATLDTVSSVVGAVNPVVGTAIKATGILSDVVDPKDQYGQSQSSLQAGLGAVINPLDAVFYAGEKAGEGDWGTAALSLIAPGYAGYSSNKEAEAEFGKLKTEFDKKKTYQAQDAYAQTVKANEGRYFAEFGGLMPKYPDEGKTIEGMINNLLGNPLGRAQQKAYIKNNKGLAVKQDDPLRHTLAGMYTSESTGPIAANILGLAHEIGGHPNTWREHVGDLYNNFIGSMVGAIPAVDSKTKEAIIGKLRSSGMLMSGKGDKKEYANGGRMVNPYNGMPNAEIEGEVVNHSNGGIQDFSHLPNHEQATTANEVSLAPKTFIFSKRIKNPVTGRPFATDAKRYTTTSEEKIFDNKQATPITSKTAKLMFSVKKQLADNLAELHEATKVYNGAQKAENEATEEFIGMLGGMYGKGGLIKRKDGSYSPRGLWDNIRANRGSGKKPTKAMLEQERKIKAQEKAMGGYMYKDGGSFNNPGFKALPGYVQAKIKGNYEYGGYTLGESYDMSEDEIKELKRQGYTFDIE